jgi:hypothetical protein
MNVAASGSGSKKPAKILLLTCSYRRGLAKGFLSPPLVLENQHLRQLRRQTQS